MITNINRQIEIKIKQKIIAEEKDKRKKRDKGYKISPSVTVLLQKRFLKYDNSVAPRHITYA